MIQSSSRIIATISQRLAHARATSFATARSLSVQGCNIVLQLRRWGIVWLPCPHSHSAELSVYPHFSMFALHLPMRDLNLFKLRQVIHGSLEPAGSDSVGLICMWLSYPDSLNLSSHSFIRSVDTLLSRGRKWPGTCCVISDVVVTQHGQKEDVLCLSTSICLRRSFFFSCNLPSYIGGAMPERM